jgi:uncharacterized protein YjiS (DUF1127 family)
MTNLNVTALPTPETSHVRQATRAAARIVALILGPLAQAYRARRDAEHLMSLNDDLLRDIGIARSDIDFIIHTGRCDGQRKWG